jgi:AcrR family transcriptional regulator
LKRRTQSERSAQTIARLVDATIASLKEVGYSRTTVKEICARSGVSHGGLFRHFSSLLELVVAAGTDLARRQIAEFGTRFQRVNKKKAPVAAALELVREIVRSPENAVFYELLVAARTDATLRQALEAPLADYYAAIRGAALLVPGLDALPPSLLDTLVFSATFLFDGEALHRTVLRRPEAEAERMALLTAFVDASIAGSTR